MGPERVAGEGRGVLLDLAEVEPGRACCILRALVQMSWSCASRGGRGGSQDQKRWVPTPRAALAVQELTSDLAGWDLGMVPPAQEQRLGAVLGGTAGAEVAVWKVIQVCPLPAMGVGEGWGGGGGGPRRVPQPRPGLCLKILKNESRKGSLRHTFKLGETWRGAWGLGNHTGLRLQPWNRACHLRGPSLPPVSDGATWVELGQGTPGRRTVGRRPCLAQGKHAVRMNVSCSHSLSVRMPSRCLVGLSLLSDM